MENRITEKNQSSNWFQHFAGSQIITWSLSGHYGKRKGALVDWSKYLLFLASGFENYAFISKIRRTRQAGSISQGILIFGETDGLCPWWFKFHFQAFIADYHHLMREELALDSAVLVLSFKLFHLLVCGVSLLDSGGSEKVVELDCTTPCLLLLSWASEHLIIRGHSGWLGTWMSS